MMHMTLYRKWRPTVFTEVYGQDHVTSVLKYEVANNRVNHAYLFCGSRGTGKTTCAKILSAAVNCEDPQNGDPCGKCPACLSVRSGRATDVLEMDAASNTGVDYIRDIRDSVIYLPAELKYKVYIIDEVHMLSDSAFNALLKTLEEPPERVIFILATTEPHKIPTTILSRCQRFDFRRIPSPIITERLMQIAKAENIDLTDGGAKLIARLAEGGMRDAVSLLELASAYGGTTDADAVSRAAGIGGRDAVVNMVKAIAAKDTESIFKSIAHLNYTASDIAVFWQELIAFYRDMTVAKTLERPEDFIESTEEEASDIKACAELFSKEKLIRHAELLDRTYSELRRGDVNKKVTAEMALLRLTAPELDDTYAALAERIAELEDMIKNGNIAIRKTAVTTEEKPIETPEKKREKKQDKEPPENKKEKPEEKPLPAEDPVKSDGEKIANWGNILDRIGAEMPLKAMYLSDAKVTYDEGSKTVNILCSDDFGAGAVSEPECIEQIRKALVSSNVKYTDCRISVQLSSASEKQTGMEEFLI